MGVHNHSIPYHHRLPQVWYLWLLPVGFTAISVFVDVHVSLFYCLYGVPFPEFLPFCRITTVIRLRAMRGATATVYAMSDVSPGWYQDPANLLQERLWNGDTWSDQTRPRPPQPYPVQSLVPSSTSGKVYAIGEVGPGGGRIFITPSTEGNSTGQYFEAAPHTDAVKAAWCSDVGALLGAFGASIGTGAENSSTAATMCTWGAFKLASEYSNNGFSDWFLPSKDELNEMYVNRDCLGGFASAPYWSSSESAANLAWYQSFNVGEQDDYLKSDSLYVRPVRTFS